MDTKYLIINNIFTLDDFLDKVYKGTLSPCRKQIECHKEVLSFLCDLIQSKTTPNYNVDGLSLLWTFEEEIGGIIIHKCFSSDKDILNIPSHIDNIPVVEFGNAAFLNLECKEIIIPSTLKKLNGICGCKNLVDITIPSCVEQCCSFSDCDSLENIFVSYENKSFCSIDGVLYDYNKTELLRCPPKKSGALEILDTVTSICHSACEECRQLISVSLPPFLERIGMNAFRNCIGVCSFVLPDSIAEISWGAFANVDRDRVICSKESYSYQYLEENYYNQYWHA